MSDTTEEHIPYKPRGNLTEGPLSGHLIRLAGPMTWGILMVISFQLVDTFYVAQLGTEALAALTFTFPLTFFIFSFIMGFAIAMSSVVSRLIGAGDEDLVRRVTTHGLMLVLFVGLALSAIGLTLMDDIFRLMGAHEELIPYIHHYMSIWFAGAVCVTLPLAGNASIRATGDAMTPAFIMTAVSVVNVILDPILIFGLFGFPRLELQGAAIATVFANAIAMLAGLYVIYAKKHLLSLHYLVTLKEFGNSAKRLLFIALPAGMTNAIQPVVNAFVITLLATNGPHVVAAFGIVSRIEAFAFVILMGIAVGMGPIIGQNFGAKNYSRVEETLFLAIRFCVFWSLGIAFILALGGTEITSLFSSDPDVIKTAALFFWIVPFSYVFSNLMRGWTSAFNAMGKPQISFVMIVLSELALLLSVWLGYRYEGIIGMFFAIAGVSVAAGTASHITGRLVLKRMAAQQ